MVNPILRLGTAMYTFSCAIQFEKYTKFDLRKILFTAGAMSQK